MYYYKNDGTYIASPKVIEGAAEISKEEYDHIKAIIDNRPVAEEGFTYRLTADMEWELYEVSVSDEITDEEALEILLGGAV